MILKDFFLSDWKTTHFDNTKIAETIIPNLCYTMKKDTTNAYNPI